MAINKKYEDWDSIIIQLNSGENSVLNIRMMRQDLEAMSEDHGTGRGHVMEMMVQAMEEQLAEKSNDALL